MGEADGELDGLIAVGHLVVAGVVVLGAVEDVDGGLHGGLFDADGLEATGKGCVGLDEAAVLLEGGGADAGELAPRERRLELARAVVGAVSAAAHADPLVDLVEEDDELSRPRRDLCLELADALREGAAQPCAGEQLAGLHLHHDAPLEATWRRLVVEAGDAACEPFDHSGLAHARVADEQRVVAPPLVQNVCERVDLLVAPHHPINLAVDRHQAQVAADAGQQRELRLAQDQLLSGGAPLHGERRGGPLGLRTVDRRRQRHGGKGRQ